MRTQKFNFARNYKHAQTAHEILSLYEDSVHSAEIWAAKSRSKFSGLCEEAGCQ